MSIVGSMLAAAYGKCDYLVIAAFCFSLLLVLCMRFKSKGQAEWPSLFAVFLMLFVPFVWIANIIEANTPARDFGVALVAIPLALGIKTIVSGLFK